jgi:C1A family cysteine protease
MEPNSLGKIESYRSGGGGHALALLDWNKSMVDSSGMPYIQMFNSWGKSWGKNGTACIKPSVVDYWCKNETVVGYSKMSVEDMRPKSYDWLKQSFYV